MTPVAAFTEPRLRCDCPCHLCHAHARRSGRVAGRDGGWGPARACGALRREPASDAPEGRDAAPSLSAPERPAPVTKGGRWGRGLTGGSGGDGHGLRLVLELRQPAEALGQVPVA